MYPSFDMLINYFGIVLLAAAKIGLHSTLYITSQLEHAVMLRQLEMTIVDIAKGRVFDYSIYEDLPSDEEVSSFISTMGNYQIDASVKEVFLDSVYFFKRCSDVANKKLSVDAIAHETWDHNLSTSIPSMLRTSKFNTNAQRCDNFGLLGSSRKLYTRTIKRSSMKSSDLSEINRNEKALELLRNIIDAFKEDPDNAGAKTHPHFLQFEEYIYSASRNQLGKLGLPVDSLAFKDRHCSFNPDEIEENILKNVHVKKLTSALINKLKNESPPPAIYDEVNLADYHKQGPENVDEKFKSLLATRNVAGIEELLSIIDAHPGSAYQITKRMEYHNRFVEYGNEPVPYPITIITGIFETGSETLLTIFENSGTHIPGIRSNFMNNSEVLFEMAYNKFKSSAENRTYQLDFLIEKGFKFSDLQKKILFKHVIQNSDANLLRSLVSNYQPAIDLHEYQKDRGITFFHSILIEGSSELKQAVIDNHLVRSPNDKVLFIPTLGTDNEIFDEDIHENEYEASQGLWTPKDDLFPSNFAGLRENIRIHKGWDSLTIAVMKGDHSMVSALMKRNADTTTLSTIYSNIKQFLNIGTSLILTGI